MLTYVGHATLVIELGGVRLLTDPLLGGAAHLRRQVARPRIDDLAGADAVLISHAHRDHLDVPSLRRIAGGARVIAPSSCRRVLRHCGAREVVGVRVGDRVAVGGVEVQAVRARHEVRRNPGGRRSEALGYVVRGSTSVYFAGDTDLFPEMVDMAGAVDVAALPIAGWGPRLPPGHLDPRRAAEAVARIHPAVAVPIHWGTLRPIGARRSAPRVDAPHRFVAAVAARAPGTMVRVLAPGESMVLDRWRRVGANAT